MPNKRRRRPPSSSPRVASARTGRRHRPQRSNSERAAKLQQGGAAGGLDSVLDQIIAGDFDSAKSTASATAEQGRSSGSEDTVSSAGKAWQMAAAFDLAQEAMADKNFEAAKSHATNAATQARALLSTDAASAGDLQLIIESAGQAWTVARKAAEKAAKEQRGGRDAPMIDQHEFNHAKSDVFCGIATMIMMLHSNGISQGSSKKDLSRLARQVYYPGKGTSGAQMASVLRDRGLKDSTYTTTGTHSRLIESLDKGQTVPFGVMHSEGTITKLEGGSSARYKGARVGDAHYKRFRGSGHWLLVTRYEGKAEAPTAFMVNDPDLGGELRCTPSQLDAMGQGSGAYWMVHQ
jgi:hypothetical protein